LHKGSDIKVRFVDRSKIKRPSYLNFDDINSAAYKELKENFDLKVKKFKCYKDDSVKDALSKIFHGKCAYCESIYAVTQPVDIEHFRPKGDNTGYWWLAAVWENLLPSCIDCNRARYHKLYDYQTGGKSKKKKLSGKQEHFPIQGVKATAPIKRAKISNRNLLTTIRSEVPSLINPTIDNAEDWFVYSNDGVISPSAVATKDVVKLTRVDATIKIIGLNRADLVSTRKEVLLQLECLIFTIEKIGILLRDEELIDRHKQALHELLVYIFKHVKSFQDSKSPYSIMCKTLIDKRLGNIIK